MLTVSFLTFQQLHQISWTELSETKRWRSQQVDYSTFEIKARAEIEEGKAEANTQGTNAEITSDRLTLGEETRAKELKQTTF